MGDLRAAKVLSHRRNMSAIAGCSQLASQNLSESTCANRLQMSRPS
jgi:hypothetical protein